MSDGKKIVGEEELVQVQEEELAQLQEEDTFHDAKDTELVEVMMMKQKELALQIESCEDNARKLKTALRTNTRLNKISSVVMALWDQFDDTNNEMMGMQGFSESQYCLQGVFKPKRMVAWHGLRRR